MNITRNVVTQCQRQEIMKNLALRYKAVVRFNTELQQYQFYNRDIITPEGRKGAWMTACVGWDDRTRSRFDIWVDKTIKYLSKVHKAQVRYTHERGFEYRVFDADGSEWMKLVVDFPVGLLI